MVAALEVILTHNHFKFMITQELLAKLRSLVDQIQDFESQCSQSGEVEQDKMAALESQLEMLKNLKKTFSQSSQEIQKLRKENKGQIKGELTEELNKELAIQAEAARQIKAQEEKLQNEKRVEAERLEKVRAQKQEQRRREQEQQAAEEAARKSRLEAQRAAQQAQEEEEKIKKSKGDKDKQEGELHTQFQESQARQQAIKDKMEKLTPKKRAGGPSGDEASKRNKSDANSPLQAPGGQDTEMSEGGDASVAGDLGNDLPAGSPEDRSEGPQDDYDMPPENGGEDQQERQSPDEYRKSLVEDLLKIKVKNASGNDMDLFSAETNTELRKIAQDRVSGQIDPADFLAEIINRVVPNTVYESLDLSGNSISEIVSKIDQEKGRSLVDEISARFEELDSTNDNADLLFHMKRFNANRTKNNRGIGNDAIFITGRGAYELTAFIVHRGGVESGHYITYVKEDVGQGQSKWFLYDDSNRTDDFQLDQNGNLPLDAKYAYFAKYSDTRFSATHLPLQQSGFSNLGKNYCWLNASLVFLGSFSDLRDKIRNFITHNMPSEELGHSSPVNANPGIQEGESSNLSANNNQSTFATPGSAGKTKKKRVCSHETRGRLTSLLVEQKQFRDFIKSLVIDSSVAEDFLLDQSHFKSPAGVNGNKWTALHYIAYTYDSKSVEEIISVAIDTLVKNSYNDQEIKIRINDWINKCSREGKAAKDILEDMKKAQDLDPKDFNDIVKSIEFLDYDIQPRINYFRSNSGLTKGLPSVKRVRKSLVEGLDMTDSRLGQGIEQSDMSVFEKIDSQEIDSDEAAALEESIIRGKFSEFIREINSEAKKKHIIFEHILNGSLVYKDYRVLNAIVVANVEDGDSLIKDSESLIDNAIKILAKEGFSINDIKKSIKSLVEHYDPKGANIKGCLKREIDSSDTGTEEKKNLRKCNRLFGQSGIQKRIDALQHRSEISKDISVRKSARLASNKSPEQGHITLADKGAAKILLSLGAPNLVSERVEDPIIHSEKISKEEYRNLVKSIEELDFGDFIRSDDLSESKKKYIIFDHIFSRGDRKSCSVLHAIMNYTRDEDFSDVFESFMQTAIEILIKEGKDTDQILEELFVVINKKDGDGFTVIDYLNIEKDYIKVKLSEKIEDIDIGDIDIKDIDILDEYLESMSTEAMTERVEELRERLRDNDRDSTLSDQDDVLSNSLRSMQVDDQRTQTDSTLHEELSIPDTGGATPAFQAPGVAPSPSASSTGAISAMSQGGWEGAQTLYGMSSLGGQGHGSGR